MTVPDEQLLHYVEDFGLYFEQFGLARTAGRMLGWLLVCDPPHQTMDELVEALQVSKSSISTMSRLLIHIGLVSKVSFPGERKDYYRVGEYAWIQGWETKNNQTNQMKQMAARGLALLPEEATERRERLQEMYDLYAFLEAELPKLTQRWLESRQKELTPLQTRFVAKEKVTEFKLGFSLSIPRAAQGNWATTSSLIVHLNGLHQVCTKCMEKNYE